jgi:hypothetical protein
LLVRTEAILEKSRVFHFNFIQPTQKLAFFWHVNCEHRFMARKINPSKLLRQNNPASQLANRRTLPPASALYLMQLRAQAMKITSPSRRLRLEISTEIDGETPQPVKIIWI